MFIAAAAAAVAAAVVVVAVVVVAAAAVDAPTVQPNNDVSVVVAVESMRC